MCPETVVPSLSRIGLATSYSPLESENRSHVTTEVGAVGAVAADPIAAISDALATGAIDADTAHSRLIDAVVASQMPPGADPAVWQAIRAEVEALLAGDPTIAELLRA